MYTNNPLMTALYPDSIPHRCGRLDRPWTPRTSLPHTSSDGPRRCVRRPTASSSRRIGSDHSIWCASAPSPSLARQQSDANAPGCCRWGYEHRSFRCHSCLHSRATYPQPRIRGSPSRVRGPRPLTAYTHTSRRRPIAGNLRSSRHDLQAGQRTYVS